MKENHFDTWIFGMSYAVREICVHYLNCMAYKFCSPGTDLQTVAKWDSNIEMVSLVMPHSKYEEMYYADEILNMKDIYYDFFAQCDYCRVVDCFHVFDNQDKYFMDVEHFNTIGGIAFSKMLAQLLE